MLVRPANRHLITKIKASITAGIRPTAMIFHEQPTAPWVDFDFLLLEAHQMLNDEICPRCGHPVWLCRSSSEAIEFHVETSYCYAERAQLESADKEKDRKSRASKEDKKSWGQFRFAVPVALPGYELPTREEYYTSLAEKRGAVE